MKGVITRANGEKVYLAERKDINELRDEMLDCEAIISEMDVDIDELNEDIVEHDNKFVAIEGEIDAIKKCVSDGKFLVASTLTSKGINTASDATFDQIAANINSIVTLSAGTNDATILDTDVLKGRIAYGKNGTRIIGAMQDLSGDTPIRFAEGNTTPVIPGDTIFSATNTDGQNRLCIRYVGEGGYIGNNTLFGIGLGHLGNATPNDVLAGKLFTAECGLVATGGIPSKGAATYTPGTSNQTINAGQYLSGAQTIKGDGNLVAGNIKAGTAIFGVTGNYDPSASAKLMRATTFYNYQKSGFITIGQGYSLSKTFSSNISLVSIHVYGRGSEYNSAECIWFVRRGSWYLNSQSSLNFFLIDTDYTYTENANNYLDIKMHDLPMRFTVSGSTLTLASNFTGSQTDEIGFLIWVA